MNEEPEVVPSTDLEPVPTAGLALPADARLSPVAEQLVDQARADGVALTGEGGLLTGLIQQVLQGALEAEIADHLGYPPHAVEAAFSLGGQVLGRR